MAILALAATLVVVNAPPPRSDIKLSAETLARELQTAIDDAIINGGRWRLEISPNEWRLVTIEGGEWVETAASGVSLRDALLETTISDPAASNEMALSGARPDQAARHQDGPSIITLEPLGDMVGFHVTIKRERDVWQVAMDDRGTITIGRPQ